jgi:hypothetical protein
MSGVWVKQADGSSKWSPISGNNVHVKQPGGATKVVPITGSGSSRGAYVPSPSGGSSFQPVRR